jgi:hypothetical protein
MSQRSASPFTPQERDLIRLELMPRFRQEPDLANGLFLRTWRAGPQKGQPKIPKAIQTMLDRGLVEIRPNPMGRPAAFFTEAGMEGLRQLLRDSRAMDSERFDYLRRKLGMGDHWPMKDKAGEFSPTRPSRPRHAGTACRIVSGWDDAPRPVRIDPRAGPDGRISHRPWGGWKAPLPALH